MGKYTQNLELYKVDTSLNSQGELADGNDTFNVDKMLNDNWDKLDAAISSAHTPFCANSGPRDSLGNANFISIDDAGVLTAAPFVYTTAMRKTYEVKENLTYNTSELAEGKYNIFVQPNNSTEHELVLMINTVYKQRFAPALPTENTIWLDLGVEPCFSYIYKSENWQKTELTPVGEIEVARGGGA